MKHRLNLDKKGLNYVLLKEIFKIMDSENPNKYLLPRIKKGRTQVKKRNYWKN